MKAYPQDERILAQKQKIASDGFSWLLLALWLSVPVQQFFFDAPPAQYAFEFICAIAFSYYIVLRNLRAGNNLFPKDTRKLKLTSSLVMAVTIAGTNAVLAYLRPDDFSLIANSFALTILVSFLIAFASGFAIFLLLYTYHERRQRQIARHLDEEEN